MRERLGIKAGIRLVVTGVYQDGTIIMVCLIILLSMQLEKHKSSTGETISCVRGKGLQHVFGLRHLQVVPGHFAILLFVSGRVEIELR